MKHIMTLSGISLLICLSISVVNAQETPSDLRDLLREESRFAASELENRGYVNTAGASSSRGVYTYWWNPNRKECIKVLTSDARYQSIVTTSPMDCNKDVHAERNDKKNSGAAIAVGAAAAAIIGAAILSNKSHHHENDQHHEDPHREAAFEQGYRDGLYNKSYHNYFNSNDEKDAYSEGYESGVDQRRSETSHHSGRGGYQEHFNVNDLRNMYVSDAQNELTDRGFRLTDSNDMSRNNFVQWWYQERTRQCYMIEYRNDRVYRIDAVNSCY